MPHKLEWFKRKFTFDLEVWMFPNLIERLRGTPARVSELASRFDTATLTRKADEKWSMQENAGHLLDLEPLWLGRVEDILENRHELRLADLTNQTTHAAGHNERSFTAIVNEFRAARNLLMQKLESCDESAILRAALHPRLQEPMRLIDLAFFVAEHDAHHLAEITRLAHRM